MLSDFPPSFSKTQKISDEDFVEVIDYGTPHSWRTKMAEQGFVPVTHTLTEIVEFCNKMEYAKEMTGRNNSQNNQNNKKNRAACQSRLSKWRNSYRCIIAHEDSSESKQKMMGTSH
jgi:hypothetical protein